MNKIVLLIKLSFCLFIFSLPALAQKQEWETIYEYGDSSRAEANSSCMDKSGNIYVVGFRTGRGSDIVNHVVIKYNSSGVQQWVNTFGEYKNANFFGIAIAVGQSGNIYVTGSTSEYGKMDAVTIKYNSSGAVLWEKKFDGDAHQRDLANSITIDKKGNVLISGLTEDNAKHADILTIKYDSSGTELWHTKFNRGPESFPITPEGYGLGFSRYPIVADVDGNLYLTGEGYTTGKPGNFLTLKYSPEGTMLWSKEYGRGAATGLALDAQGNIYITGANWYTQGNQTNWGAGTTLKYNPAGELVWDKLYDTGDSNIDKAIGIVVDDNNDIIIAGYSSNSSVAYDGSMFCVKYSNSGTRQWVYTSAKTFIFTSCFVKDANNNFFIGGISYTGNENDPYRAAILKINASGALLGSVKYGNSFANSTSLNVDGDDNIYLVGFSLKLGTGKIFTLKYSNFPNSPATLSEENFSKEVQIFPNPTTGNFTIAVPPAANSIEIINALGQVEQKMIIDGQANLNFQIKNNGIYYIQIATQNEIITRKIVVSNL